MTLVALVWVLFVGWILAAAFLSFAALVHAAVESGFTSGLAAYFHVLIWMVPGTAFASFIFGQGTGEQRALRFLLVFAAGFLAYALNLQLRRLIVPDYPSCGPHEVVVILTTLPTLAALVALTCLPFARTVPVRFPLRVSVSLAVLAALLFFGDYRLFRDTMRNTVPITTREICYASYEDFTGDTDEFAMRATVSPQVAAEVIQSLKLPEVEGSIGNPRIRGEPIPWWTPGPHTRHFGAFDPSGKRGSEPWEGCGWEAGYVGDHLYVSQSCSFL